MTICGGCERPNSRQASEEDHGKPAGTHTGNCSAFFKAVLGFTLTLPAEINRLRAITARGLCSSGSGLFN